MVKYIREQFINWGGVFKACQHLHYLFVLRWCVRFGEGEKSQLLALALPSTSKAWAWRDFPQHGEFWWEVPFIVSPSPITQSLMGPPLISALPFPKSCLPVLSPPRSPGWPGQGLGGSWSACVCCLSSPWQLIPQLSWCDSQCVAPDWQWSSQGTWSREQGITGRLPAGSPPLVALSLLPQYWDPAPSVSPGVFQSLCTDLSNFFSL